MTEMCKTSKLALKKFNISRRQIEERAAAIHYVGNEEIYRNNLDYVLERFLR
jgi:hypothetical protein